MTNGRVVVVGAGVSGLTAAWALQRGGTPVTVLEAEPRAGGQIRSVERDGFVLESGPNGYLDREGHVTRLAEALGLGHALRPLAEAAERRAIFVRGKVRELPASPPKFFTSDVVPWWAKLRLLLEPFTARGPADDESLKAFGRRHVGRHVTDHLVDAVQTGIFAGDGERLSLRSGFPRLWRMEHEHRSLLRASVALKKAGGAKVPRMGSFEGGLSTLTDALAAALGSDLVLGTRVRSLEREGGRWRVVHDRGVETADRVLLSVPAHVAAPLLASLDPVLAETLGSIPYVPVSVVHLGWTPALSPDPEGFGILVPPVERRKVLGILFVSSAYPFRARPGTTLVTTLVGGAHAPEVAALPDAELVDVVRAEHRALVGITRPPDLVEVVRWPRAIPQYEVGHQARLDALAGRLRALPGLVLGGNAYRGPGIADCVKDGLALAEQLAHPAGTSAAA